MSYSFGKEAKWKRGLSALPERTRTKADANLSDLDRLRFITEDKELGKDRIDPEDVYALSIDLDQQDKLIEESGFDPDDPLELLVKSIVSAHKAHASKPEEGLAEAMRAITGKERRGRPNVDDYDILLAMAWEEHLRQFKGEKQSSVTESMKRAYEKLYPSSSPIKRRDDAEDSKARRIRDKYQQTRELLLARVTREMDPDRMDRINQLTTAAKILKDLGVGIDLSVIRPRLRRRK